jgi:preprotein translocase subunit SecA
MLDLLRKEWKKRVDYFGKDIAQSILVYAVISTLDPLWVEHLTALDDLRDGVRLRGYAQKDPLIEYRKEGYEMFQELLGKFEYNLARKLFRLEPVQNPINVPKNVKEYQPELDTNNSETSAPPADQTQVSSSSTAPPRNGPCPCGSGKKYKKCCYPQYG